MSSRFVRSSKYRHVFGRSTRKEQCYDNLRISRNAWDTNLIKANPSYISVNWEASGGGAFAVIPIHERGRLPEQIPLFRGHTAVVLDTDWSPFDDSLIASGSDDGKAFLWKVPQDFQIRSQNDEELPDVQPFSKLTGHSRKIGHVLFNPAADRVLATSSGDHTVKLWDVEQGAAKLTLGHDEIVQGLSWSANGALLVTTSRDKKLRIWDVRQEKPAHVGAGHAGAKNSRVVWMGENDRIATTGFSKMSDRQLGLWDVRNPDQPMDGFERLDSISGVCIPFWDDGTQCLYLAGKGDGNIRYYEYQKDKFEYLSEYKSSDPQRGVAFLPKRGVNVHENEVMRGFKTVNDGYIEPISFIVPRRAEVFQDDIFPPTVGLEAAFTAADWFNGANGLPPKIDLGAVYSGTAPQDVPSTPSKPTSVPLNLPSPAKKDYPTDSMAQADASTGHRGPPPTMREQTASIKDLATKYNDEDEDDSGDDASSFEEVSKPIERNIKATPQQLDTSAQSSTPITANPPITNPVVAQEGSLVKDQQSQSSSTIPASPLTIQKPTNTVASQPSSPLKQRNTSLEVKASLSEIKALLEQQNKAMIVQNETISRLTAEVDRLKSKMEDE